ncbi:MAG: EF-P lysine aminoacylase GenX [Proteobacteria bacterium]|nr:EF-P lysine aminoacylase GenX [Pseudomonadota bacterium]MBU4294410.1 EF-P lysine aminoacylase GenX [Pseudomonadota bacterium]MCG2747592.1 EF-P lysine aminoacylase GenX [Desulfobulbaceae bacterium]
MANSFLSRRAEIIQSIRTFFINRGYLEVDTPIRLPCLIPEAHIEPEQSSGWFLQTSPEMCMKRLLAAGHREIFQICRCFRRNERGSRHLPEFTMLEWYRVGIDYIDLMAECAGLLRFVATRVDCPDRSAAALVAQADWQYLTVQQAFALFAPVSAEQALAEDSFDEILVRDVEPNLGRGRPTFLHDYPAALGSLARLKNGDNRVAERFELYVNGLELANGFSELTDADEQRLRFIRERALIEGQGRQPGPMPDRFLADLGELQSAAGIALGVDRLVMLLCGARSIDEVVAFTPENL